MEKSTPVEGQDRYMGKTTNGLNLLEIIGDKQNISQVTLTVGFPKDKPHVVITNSTTLSIFLQNVVPEWNDSSGWIKQTINNFACSSNDQKKVFGNKLIEISFIKSVRVMDITVVNKSSSLKNDTETSEKMSEEMATKPCSETESESVTETSKSSNLEKSSKNPPSWEGADSKTKAYEAGKGIGVIIAQVHGYYQPERIRKDCYETIVELMGTKKNIPREDLNEYMDGCETYYKLYFGK